jgi:hypothetical protein
MADVVFAPARLFIDTLQLDLRDALPSLSQWLCHTFAHPTECHLALSMTSCQPGQKPEPSCQPQNSLVWKGCWPDGGMYITVPGWNPDCLVLTRQEPTTRIRGIGDSRLEFPCRVFCYSGLDEIHTRFIAIVSAPTTDFSSNGGGAEVSVFGYVPLLHVCLLLTAFIVCLLQARIL